MKLFWHIGPHKTGTTSLQNALAAHASSGRASYYYPPTPEFGPGHAAMAFRLLGLNQVEKVADAVQSEVERARSLGFSKMVISSEEFSRAISTADGFEPLGRICDQVECELLLTLRPLTARVHPEVQEMIKHGRTIQFTIIGELLAACNERPGLRADFLPSAIAGMRPASTSVILVDEAAPQKLFDDLSNVLDEKIQPPRNPIANASYSFIKTAWLEAVNRYLKARPDAARAAVEAAYSAASRQMETLSAVPYPALPPPLQRYLDGVWTLQMAYLGALAEGGHVRVL